MSEYVIDLDEGLYTEQEWFEIINGRSRVIRCKDCKYCKPLSSFHKHLGCYNDFLNKHEAIPVCEQGFCAWGEPRRLGD